jgi:hypothetical protein
MGNAAARVRGGVWQKEGTATRPPRQAWGYWAMKIWKPL